jgi:hypothetical protein
VAIPGESVFLSEGNTGIGAGYGSGPSSLMTWSRCLRSGIMWPRHRAPSAVSVTDSGFVG